MSKWIPIGEAAKYLGISKDTLRRWENAGKIKPQRSPTNRRYYTKEQLDELIGKRPKPTKKAKRSVASKKSGVLKLFAFGSIGLVIAVLIALATILFLL
ncbi:hypothetical protein AMJ51_01190 [Microgenomates bacterium DG_75]|nr:MAG: hypothetical protein AMJ51_01190 [Microgenomates bacterium DG_75]